MLTRAGVNKVAEMLRRRAKAPEAQEASSSPGNAQNVTTALEEKKEQGGPIEERAEAARPVRKERRVYLSGDRAVARVKMSRNLPNRKLMACEIDGFEEFVLVRDTAFYRQGEDIDVMFNDLGRWEAAVHRTQPKYR